MHMRGDEACKVLCDPLTLDAAKAKKFQTRVEEEYRVNMCASCAAHGLRFCLHATYICTLCTGPDHVCKQVALETTVSGRIA